MKAKKYILLYLITIASLSAASLKKVLILDIINIEKKANYQYLEASITEAVQKSLKEKFAFKETRRKKWQQVAKDNYIYRKDYYTQTAAMNLGLLAKQDIVISGGYKIEIGKTNASAPTILTHVQILDISKRKVISEFTMKGHADSTIFQSVEKIAQRISLEARSILPSKAAWAKKGLSDDGPSVPILEDIAVGLRVGGGFYAAGLGDRLTTQLPTLSLVTRGNIPKLWSKLAFQIDATYMKESPKAGSNPNLEGTTGSTTNYLLGGFFLLDFGLTDVIGIHPKIGGGYAMQSTVVTGVRNENFNNGIPFAAGGVDLSYLLNKNLSLVMSLQTYAEFETSNVTLLNLASVGVNYGF